VTILTDAQVRVLGEVVAAGGTGSAYALGESLTVLYALHNKGLIERVMSKHWLTEPRYGTWKVTPAGRLTLDLNKGRRK